MAHNGYLHKKTTTMVMKRKVRERRKRRKIVGVRRGERERWLLAVTKNLVPRHVV